MSVKTPVRDFVKKYAESKTSRFHMPGHKGKCSELGVEAFDITEIKGADYLFEADGIIGESEKICSDIFNTQKTLYSTEGSSLSIKTMITLAALNRKDKSKRGVIISPRNSHKAFVNGCILADCDVKWIFPKGRSESVCCSDFTPEEIEEALVSSENVCAVYVTSPDYLGNIPDLRAVSEICRRHDVPFIVDNAHGAYLKFLSEDIHPITLGADMCCDSAHKTLPVLTGGGYLHISKDAPEFFYKNAKRVMSMYASTSPSFLILQSLDMCNMILADGFKEKVQETANRLESLCDRINAAGFEAKNSEPLKLSVFPNEMGYTGDELSERLRQSGVEAEYSDENAVVLMASPYNNEEDFKKVLNAFLKIEKKSPPVTVEKIALSRPEVRCSLREAAFSESCTVSVDEALGRVCALTVTSCQPSVPVAVSGEVIDEKMIKIFKRYSIFEVNVLK